MSDTTAQSRPLASDQRGALMVMGIFMAMLLVGFIYYVAGLGDTILFRERMQDSSDAGAWAAAVIHARGMNVIVMINMIMAAIAAVLIALKIILLILQILSIVAKILSAIPYTAAVGAALQAVVDPCKEVVSEVHDAVQDFADEILPILTKAERAIAKAIPPLAEVKVVWMSQDSYHDPVSFGFMYSKTLTNLSLPVEDDECSRIEDEGKDYISGLIMKPFGADSGMADFMDTAMDVIGDVAMMVNGRVCGDDGGSTSTDVDLSSVYEETGADDECDGDDPPDWCDDAQAATQGEIQGTESGSAGDETHPQKVKDDCYLGDACFQLRVFMIAQDGKLDGPLQRVRLGNWGREVEQNGAETVELLSRISAAQAEFYYHDSAAHDLRDDWMWHMRWKARLRRFSLGDTNMMNNACTGGDFCSSLSSITDIVSNVLVH